jgi:hypothetical protein
VIQRCLVLVAFACCGLVLASFGMFARDQLADASTRQQNELASPQNGTVPAPAVHRGHSQPRRFIDGAAQKLTSPFRSIVRSHSQWVLHAVPALIAILVYGGGLGFLARYSRGTAHGALRGSHGI